MTPQDAAIKDFSAIEEGENLGREKPTATKLTYHFGHPNIYTPLSSHVCTDFYLSQEQQPQSPFQAHPPAQWPASWELYRALHLCPGAPCGLQTHELKEKLPASK